MAESTVDCPVRGDFTGEPIDVAAHVEEAHQGGYRMGRWAGQKIEPRTLMAMAVADGHPEISGWIGDAVARQLIAQERRARAVIETPAGNLRPGEVVTLVIDQHGKRTRRAGYMVGMAQGHAPHQFFKIHKGGPHFDVTASQVVEIAR